LRIVNGPVAAIESSEHRGIPPVPGVEILVVDDDGPTRELVVRWLTGAGFVCREASSGEEALLLVTSEPERYKAVVLDVMMPGIDGFEVFTRLKTSTTGPLPVLFLTASASDEEIVRGVQAGAAAYVLKPFSGPVLIAKLRQVLDRTEADWVLRRKLSSAERSATQDGLTGLLNRRSFDERLIELVAYSARHREALALLMVDIDHFKMVNDAFGHPGGDVALRFVADSVRRVLRLGDLAFRYGGEEFAILLRKCDATGGLGVYERLREGLKKTPADVGRGESRLLTVSGGLATMEAENGFAHKDLVARADRALYRAKHEGRDRVEREWG
jgi:diguanylate cyclase (GGDEF)-like protein